MVVKSNSKEELILRAVKKLSLIDRDLALDLLNLLNDTSPVEAHTKPGPTTYRVRILVPDGTDDLIPRLSSGLNKLNEITRGAVVEEKRVTLPLEIVSQLNCLSGRLGVPRKYLTPYAFFLGE